MSKKKSSEKSVDVVETKPLVVDEAAFDPDLASLFASSSGPVQVVSRPPPRIQAAQTDQKKRAAAQESEESDSDRGASIAENNEDSETEDKAILPDSRPRKRRRVGQDEDIETTYLNRLAQEEEKEQKLKRKEKKTAIKALAGVEDQSASEEDAAKEDETSSEGEGEGDSDEGETFGDDGETIPVHETVQKPITEADKSKRTIFLSNVSTNAIKSKSSRKALLTHLKTALDTKLNEKIESIRFRSTAFVSGVGPKRAAFAKKELMEETAQGTNAYVVLSNEAAARKVALKLNGSIALDRHIHIDSLANPTRTDNKRCVFVGNLPFVDEETNQNADDDDDTKRRPKAKLPADAEEGLWRTFAKCGKIESVRVVRDKATRVGKGFAYVQFDDGNGVEKALELDGKRFPPLLPRTLRVMRAKRMPKKEAATKDSRNGKSGVGSRDGTARKGKLNGVVFEGYRASSNANKMKLGRKSRVGKPGGRSSKRGAAFKASGGKKKRDRD